jgi:hypothetical protein
MTVYYKVVRKAGDGRLMSCFIGSSDSLTDRFFIPYRMEYPVGEWLSQRFDQGPMAVFETLEQAKRFIHKILSRFAFDYQIYSCSIERSDDECVWFMSNGKVKQKFHDLPEGTVLAKLVKLDQLVYEVHWSWPK